MHRRDLLRFSFGATLMLGSASLLGCTASAPASGYRVLRDNDLPLLRAVIPAIVEGDLEAILVQLDTNLGALSPAMLGLTRQLFDVLTMPFTRGPLTGVWGAWEYADPSRVQAFLLRWQDSSLDLLRQGYCSLLQLVLMAWYSLPAAWPSCGYPGPPRL